MFVLVLLGLFISPQVVTKNLFNIRCWVRFWGRGEHDSPGPALPEHPKVGGLGGGNCRCVEGCVAEHPD